jgi:hypothetical protein
MENKDAANKKDRGAIPRILTSLVREYASTIAPKTTNIENKVKIAIHLSSRSCLILTYTSL